MNRSSIQPNPDYAAWLGAFEHPDTGTDSWQLPDTLNVEWLPALMRALYLAGYGSDEARELITGLTCHRLRERFNDGLEVVRLQADRYR